jgi:hypothetical protein
MLESGAGSELPQPPGYALAGGLMPRQILTLCTTSVIYLCLDRVQRFLAPDPHARLPRLAEKPGEAGADRRPVTVQAIRALRTWLSPHSSGRPWEEYFVVPVDVVRMLPARDAAQKFGLAF